MLFGCDLKGLKGEESETPIGILGRNQEQKGMGEAEKGQPVEAEEKENAFIARFLPSRTIAGPNLPPPTSLLSHCSVSGLCERERNESAVYLQPAGE